MDATVIEYLFAGFAKSWRSLRAQAFALVLLSALSSSIQAQMAPETQVRSWDFSVWSAGATGEELTNSFAEAQIFTAGVFVGRAFTGDMGTGWRRGWFQYGMDFIPLFVQFAPRRISGIAFDPVILRWNPHLRRGRVEPFLELGGGALHTNSDFPTGNTSTFNFTARGGGGIRVATRRSQALEIACRWWHISNANLGSFNPEFNGIQVSLGWHWFR